MKIIYLADIHGAFAQVKKLLSLTDAQAYIIAGDLIDRPFYTEEMAARYRTLQTYVSGLYNRMGADHADMDDFVEDLSKRTDLSGDIPERAAEYRDATIRARRVLQQKYKVLESILFLKGASQIFCLPGNYDMDLQYTSLHGRDLHRHWHHVADLRIAGYGGADVATPGIPQRYAVPYNADRGIREMTRFFAETRPDIIVTHKPAQGIHDHVSPMGESGSPELRRFCEEYRVPLCLTGHIHDQWGFEEIDGTIYLNPSNFGKVTQPGGQVAEGGFFYSIDTRDRQIVGISLGKLVRDRVHDVVAYSLRQKRWDKHVLDPERFGALIRGKSHDCIEGTGKWVPRDMLKQEMRWFFPGRGAEEMVRTAAEEIERVLLRAEEQCGASVGVDLLEGEDAPSSGLNLVLQIRCGGLHPEGKEPHGEENCGSRCREALKAIQAGFTAFPHIRITDWIDLDRVLRSLQRKDYECDATQRFAAYLAIRRTLRGGDAAFAADRLAADPVFRGEIEGTGWSYLEIFRNLAGRVETMKIFEARLRELGITAPEAFRRKIGEVLHGTDKTQDQNTD
jgi:Icc-related predicted phosphoesterase